MKTKYTPDQIENVGKHDYERSDLEDCNTFSISIFKWVMKSRSKNKMKRSTAIVRVSGMGQNQNSVERTYAMADAVVNLLDAGTWTDKRKTIIVK